MGIFTELEPILSFCIKLDKNDTIEIIVSILVIVFSLFVWCWVCFYNGANIWSMGIRNYYKKIGISCVGKLPLFSPIALKTAYVFRGVR